MPKDQRFGQAAILSSEQLQELCNSFPVGQHKYISLVLAFSGARVSEVLALQWRDIKEDYILFKSINTKTKQSREKFYINFEKTFKRLERKILVSISITK